ncbi:hypothetical protein ACWKWN_18395 [Microbacterium trichothecenolyticum]
MNVTPAYDMWVARIRDEGAVHMPLDEVPGELVTFRRELRRAVTAAGMKLRTSSQHGRFVAWDPDHVVSEQRMRDALEALSLELPATDPDCPSCGTRTTPRGRAWWCHHCDIAVLGVGGVVDSA